MWPLLTESCSRVFLVCGCRHLPAYAQRVAPSDNQRLYGTDESAIELGEQLTHYMFAWVCLLWTCLIDIAYLALNPSSSGKMKFGSS